ncbi:Polysialic acid transport protein KpsM [Maliponia aquimaris]|uniref:Polysialic acid transport protein KpsM n=2 Tax=Maliponia aquimaris TaxID=1673631 RepID=A0A238K0Q9_9RHOB|nr:Polysialic acid transport protein KpsM [Maliponia aquimaris]
MATAQITPPGTFGRILILLDRERRTRFAGGVLGYLWAYITPIVWIALIVGLFVHLGRTPPIDAELAIFVTTGVLPYVAFRQTVTALSRVLPAHRHLRYLPGVSTDSVLWAAMLLEAFNLMISALLIFGSVTLLFGSALPASLPGVLSAFLVAWVLGIGVGRFVAIGGLISPTFARFVPLALRPFFWLSGVFYVAAELPGPVRELLWYSPFLHVTELLREGYFLSFTSQFADAQYPLMVGAVLYLASMPLERFAADRRLLRRMT